MGNTAPDVIVVGGGVIGLSVAWRVAGAGPSVDVLDPHPGRGASAAAAGMLAPVTELHYGEEDLLRLGLASSEMYPGFVAELEDASGQSVGYARSGTLMVARDADDAAAVEDLYRYQVEHDLKVERLSSREAREMEPGLSPRTRGGLFMPGDHRIDNRALAEALVTACERSGVTFRRDRAARLITEGERVAGVEIAGGETIPCRTVVLSAGCWSAALEGIPPEAIPRVRPVKGQLVYVSGADIVGRNLRGLEVYLVPRGDGRTVIGATVEEMGFDTTVTAGAVYTLLRDAYELLPGIAELELTETVAGLRPGSPDNAPMLGPSGLDGLLVATGHYRNGILLTPVTAALMAELVTTGTVPELMAPFSPRRFGRGLRGAQERARSVP